MTKYCSQCGKETPKLYPGNTCQGCYNYFRKGGTINNPPNRGEITYDNRGFVICHVCGRAYRRLGSHIRESHGITISEYKEIFGLCNNSRTTEANYSQHMRDLAYKNNMPALLIKVGESTRIKRGEKDRRLGKKVRLQECLGRAKRNKKSV